MPITVAHEPSFYITGDYAYRAARQQAQNKVAREQQVLAQRDAQLQAERQARTYDNLVDNQFALQKSREDAQADLSKQQAQNEFDLQEAGLKNQWLDERTKMRALSAQDLQGQRLDRGAELETAKAMDLQAKEVTKVLNDPYLDEQGKVKAAKLASGLRAVQAQRGRLPHAAYSQAMSQWMDDVANSGIEDHIKPPPTPEDVFKQQSYKDEEGNVYGIEHDKNGRPSLRLLKEVDKEGVKSAVPSQQQMLSDPTIFKERRKLAEEKLVAEREAKIDPLKPTKPAPPTNEEILERMIKDRKEDEELLLKYAEGGKPGVVSKLIETVRQQVIEALQGGVQQPNQQPQQQPTQEPAQQTPKESAQPVESPSSLRDLESIIAENGWDPSKWSESAQKKAESFLGSNTAQVLMGLHEHKVKKIPPKRFFEHFKSGGLTVGTVYSGVVGPDGKARNMIWDGESFVSVDGD